ncbi:hypothetical protein [Enterobacter bugandensis]|uniref:CIS tube protein n=1 Tax=Enterobacter bugandensis TaxID=881260 RepID=UPI002FD1545A
MSLINQLVSPKLTKLTIEAYSDATFKKSISSSGVSTKKALVLPYNPESVNCSYGSLFRRVDAIDNGSSTGSGKKKANNLEFDGSVPGTLSMSLILDATLAENSSLDIAETIKILETFGFSQHSKENQPPYLKVSWGEVIWGGEDETFKCRLQNMSYANTLFAPNGKVLRATVNLTFIQESPLRSFKESAAALSLPDVNVTAPDLPVLATLMALIGSTAALYDESLDYLSGARENDMDNLHDMVPGQTMIFGTQSSGKN